VVEMPCAMVPKAPPSFYGMGHLRGNLIPVYQLYSYLGLDIPRKKIVFCMGKGDKSLGLLIDQLPKAQKIAVNRDATGVVEHRFSTMFTGVPHLLDGKTIYILSSTQWLGELFEFIAKLQHSTES